MKKNLLARRLADRGSGSVRRSSVVLRAVGASLLAASLVFVAGCSDELNPFSDAWSRARIDLVESFTGDKEYHADWPYYDDFTDMTVDVCGTQTNCVQAISNQYLTLLKFKSVADAADYVATLGADGVQIDPLVINFNGPTSLSAQEREEIVNALSNINAGSED